MVFFWIIVMLLLGFLPLTLFRYYIDLTVSQQSRNKRRQKEEDVIDTVSAEKEPVLKDKATRKMKREPLKRESLSPRPIQKKGTPSHNTSALEMNRHTLKQAIIMSEILKKPKGL